MTKFFFLFISLFFLMMKNKFINFYYNLLFFISLMFLFDFNNNFDSMFYKMSLYFMMDYYSFMLILLSIWIISLMLMTLNFFDFSKIFMFLIMMIILFMVFSMKNLLLFYLFFELSLIPIFLIVIYWGYNPERMEAAYYMLMYTMLISLPLLIYIMMIFFMDNFNLDFSLLILKNNYKNLTLWSFLIIMGAFLIKLPLFMFHIWLPKAHVEAPVYGSMILAAILLKLGGYGIMRLLMIFLKSSIKFSNLLISISLIGSLIISLVCFMQIDMKSMVAYSSVVHMNLMLCSLMTLSKMGFLSAYMIMISHGLCSSGLFYMVNLYYYRTSSRLMMFNKGMINIIPMFSMWWFFLCSSNFSFPLSFNFFSEIMLLSVLINWNLKMIYLLILINFFSSLYSLYLYSFIQHGNLTILNKFNSGKIKEVKLIYLHYFPLLMILLNMNLF